MRPLLLLLALATPARADAIPDDAWYPRVTAGAALGYRAGDLGVLAPGGVNLSLTAEVKVRPALFVAATYDHAPATAHDEATGRDLAVTSRLAQLAVRNPLMSFGDKPTTLGGDLFVQAGLAREWLAWDGGGMHRDVVMFGFGGTIVLPHQTIARHVRYGARFFAGRAPDPAKAVPGCDGPCDTPTATAPYDLAIVVEVSCHVGR